MYVCVCICVCVLCMCVYLCMCISMCVDMHDVMLDCYVSYPVKILH